MAFQDPDGNVVRYKTESVHFDFATDTITRSVSYSNEPPPPAPDTPMTLLGERRTKRELELLIANNSKKK
jgi:hypothetical protein